MATWLSPAGVSVMLPRMQRVSSLALLVVTLGACGGGEPAATTQSTPPASTGTERSVARSPVTLEPSEGGTLVKWQALDLGEGDELVVETEPNQEVFLYVESGGLERYGEGSVVHLRGSHTLPARAGTRVIAARAEAPDAAGQEPIAQSSSLEEAAVLPNAGGKLRVQIFFDAAAGARFGAFSLLDGDADLSVPEHVHATSVESLYVLSGDGRMILGEERTPLEAGSVVYVPADTNHGYEHGTEPLRVLQVYAPPGPEQRFRPE